MDLDFVNHCFDLADGILDRDRCVRRPCQVGLRDDDDGLHPGLPAQDAEPLETTHTVRTVDAVQDEHGVDVGDQHLVARSGGVGSHDRCEAR